MVNGHLLKYFPQWAQFAKIAPPPPPPPLPHKSLRDCCVTFKPKSYLKIVFYAGQNYHSEAIHIFCIWNRRHWSAWPLSRFLVGVSFVYFWPDNDQKVARLGVFSKICWVKRVNICPNYLALDGILLLPGLLDKPLWLINQPANALILNLRSMPLSILFNISSII